jgi:hypothetical protein
VISLLVVSPPKSCVYLYSDTRVLHASPMTSNARITYYVNIHWCVNIKYSTSPVNSFPVFRYSITLSVVCIVNKLLYVEPHMSVGPTMLDVIRKRLVIFKTFFHDLPGVTEDNQEETLG